MKRRVAICGGHEAVADFVQGGVKLTPPPPPVKIGLTPFWHATSDTSLGMLCMIVSLQGLKGGAKIIKWVTGSRRYEAASVFTFTPQMVGI